jgi:hypothetical protein
MTLRYALTRLERSEARRAFGRTWLWICLAGAAVTLAADGGRDFFLVLVAWLVCIFTPVRIAVELLHSAGPRWKGALQQRLLGRPDRYASPEGVALMVEWFASRDVHAPRLAPPDLTPKVVTAASRVCGTALAAGGPDGLRRAAGRCAALLDRWLAVIAAGEGGLHAVAANGDAPGGLWNPRADIQEQWGTLRALAGFAALTKVLVAVYEDSAGRRLDGGDAVRAEADAAMDYVDQIGLRLEGPAWDAVPGVPRDALPAETTARLVETWLTFYGHPLPAPRRLAAFVDVVVA